jgi:hypothetical protein
MTNGLILDIVTDSGATAGYWKISSVFINCNEDISLNQSSYIRCVLYGWMNKNKYQNGKKIVDSMTYDFSTQKIVINGNKDFVQQMYDILVTLPEWVGAIID